MRIKLRNEELIYVLLATISCSFVWLLANFTAPKCEEPKKLMASYPATASSPVVSLKNDSANLTSYFSKTPAPVVLSKIETVNLTSDVLKTPAPVVSSKIESANLVSDVSKTPTPAPVVSSKIESESLASDVSKTPAPVVLPKSKSAILASHFSKTATPVVSVIIPVSGRADMLPKAMDSILKQSFSSLELIIVSDGFDESTRKVVESYAARDHRVRYFEFPGPSGTAIRGRNKGLLESRGEFIAFLDSDDVSTLDRLEHSLDIIRNKSVDVVYGAWIPIIHQNNLRNFGSMKNNSIVLCEGADLQSLLRINPICQSTVIVRKEAIKKAGFVKPWMQYREDHEWWMRLANAGAKFECTHTPMTKLLLHKGNTEIKFESTSEMWLQQSLEQYQKPGPFAHKIAFVVSGVGTSGGIYVLLKHAMHLIDRGHDVFFISLATDCGVEGGEILDWAGPHSILVVCKKDLDASYTRNLDAVIATHWSTAEYTSLFTSCLRMYFVQSDERRFAAEDRIYVTSVNSTYSMDFTIFTEALWIQSWLKREFHKESYYVPNGVDYSLFYPPKEGNLRRKLRILLEGPIDIPWKGMQDAYDAVKDLGAEIWVVSSCGAPPSSWKVDNFLGKMKLTEMGNIYRSVDIFVKMSRVEGFFGPPLEAMACGVAVMVGKVTGYDEYIINGTNALVVEPGDVSTARRHVAHLLNNQEYRHRLVANGFETAKKWSWQRSFDHLDSMFNTVLPKLPSGWRE